MSKKAKKSLYRGYFSMFVKLPNDTWIFFLISFLYLSTMDELVISNLTCQNFDRFSVYSYSVKNMWLKRRSRHESGEIDFALIRYRFSFIRISHIMQYCWYQIILSILVLILSTSLFSTCSSNIVLFVYISHITAFNWKANIIIAFISFLPSSRESSSFSSSSPRRFLDDMVVVEPHFLGWKY